VAVNTRKLSTLTLAFDTSNSFEAQVQSWELSNDTDDPEKIYSYGSSTYNEDFEEVDPAWSLSLTFYSDWTETGISDYFMAHDGETVSFELIHHPARENEAVMWSGQLRIKAPNVGGEIRETETQEATFQIIGEPLYERVPAEDLGS